MLRASVSVRPVPEGLARSAGPYRGDRFQRIVIVTEEASPPCGACLQVLREFGSELRIELATPDQIELVTSIAELLPRAYAPED